jgi:hypothetical protein
MDEKSFLQYNHNNNLVATLLGNDPIWESYASSLRPTTMRDAFYWSNFLRSSYGDIVSSVHRGVSYFIGGVELISDNDSDYESLDEYEKQLIERHQILPLLTNIGMDLQFNGNVFLTVVKPIKRTIQCPRCGSIRYLDQLVRGEDYHFREGVFSSKCSCGFNGDFVMKDLVVKDENAPLNVVSWNPMNINLDYCSLTNSERIWYTPESSDMEFLEDESQSTALSTLPATLLEAMYKKQSILFNPNSILHLKQSTDAIGRSYSHGWGLPRWLSAFKYLIMLMLLERQLESSVKDFMLPIRILYPDQSQRGSDPSVGSQHNIHLQHLKQQVTQALGSHARKQSSWHLLPQAIGSLQLGGDGKAIIPIDIFEYIKSGLLDVLCIPDEFRKTTLFSGANAQPISLRMFEKTWANDALQYDLALRWYLKQCSVELNWPDLEGVLLRPSIVNDPARMQIMAQEVAEGRMSRSTFYKAMNIDMRSERKLLMQEAIEDAKFQQELNTKLNTMGIADSMFATPNQMILQAGSDAAMAQQQQGMPPQGDPTMAQGGAPMPPQSGAPAGGAPMPGAVAQPTQTGDPMADIQNMASMRPGAKVTVEQLNVDAQMAAQIIFSTPVGAPRNQLYTMIKNANPDLHAIVSSMVDQLERQASRQGLEMARQGQI